MQRLLPLVSLSLSNSLCRRRRRQQGIQDREERGGSSTSITRTTQGRQTGRRMRDGEREREEADGTEIVKAKSARRRAREKQHTKEGEGDRQTETEGEEASKGARDREKAWHEGWDDDRTHRLPHTHSVRRRMKRESHRGNQLPQDLLPLSAACIKSLITCTRILTSGGA